MPPVLTGGSLLFVVFSKIGLFAFGGAYSFLPLIEKEM
jgi:chromate transport protein ChrA